MDFPSFKADVQKLSTLIIADAFTPDVIVGVARGGWTPAMLLSRFLGIKNLYSVGLTYSDATRTTISVYQKIELPAAMRTVLVVEDFIESGKCIKYAVDMIGSNTVDVRTAALGYLDKTILIPTYSLGCVSDIPKMPWD